MQWSALEGADPQSPATYVKHLAALEKAAAKCKEKLEASLSKSLEKLSVEGKKGGPKCLGKDGTPRKASLTPRRDLEKSETGSASSSSGLEKPPGTLEVQGGKKKSKRKTLEKVPESLEKDKKPKALNQSHDDDEEEEEALEKDQKPVVVVDWYNTLWVGKGIPPENLAGLEKLCQAAQVTILSFVGSWKRAQEVEKDMQEHVPDHLQQIIPMEVCKRKVGKDGKCHHACDWGAEAIFDDCAAIIRECQEWGLEVYPINTLQEGHARAGGGYETFADAVEAYLKNHQ